MAVIAKIEPELVSVQSAEIMTGRSRWSRRRDAYEGKDCQRETWGETAYPDL